MTIEELAEKKYPTNGAGGIHNLAGHYAFRQGAELAIGFLEWAEPMYSRNSKGFWVDKFRVSHHTTTDLFQIYLNQLNNK